MNIDQLLARQAAQQASVANRESAKTNQVKGRPALSDDEIVIVTDFVIKHGMTQTAAEQKWNAKLQAGTPLSSVLNSASMRLYTE